VCIHSTEGGRRWEEERERRWDVLEWPEALVRVQHLQSLLTVQMLSLGCPITFSMMALRSVPLVLCFLEKQPRLAVKGAN
jgi:hypothetical protein